MSLKPVLVVIPQRTLRFISGRSGGCPPVLVARRPANSEQQCNSEGGAPSAQTARREIVPVSIGELSRPLHNQTESSRSISEEGEEGEGGGTEEGGSGDEAVVESEGTGGGAPPSRSVKHKAVEQRRKKKISDAVQQLLEALQPPSLAGKITRAEILERAVDKIKTLKDENEQLKAKIDNLPHVQPGKETELFGELSKQITEFLTLKTQLELMEKQRNESHDQETESHDLGVESHDLEIEPHDSVQDQDQTIASGEPPAASCANPSPAPAPAIPLTSSRNSSTTGVAEARMANTGHIGGEPSSMDVRDPTEAPPPVSAHQPWPVTSILSQDTTASHCQHTTTTNNRIVPTSCHGRSNLTSSGGQNIQNTPAHISAVSSVSNVSAHVHNVSPVSSVSNVSHNVSPVSSVSVFHQPASRVCMINSSPSSSAHQRSVVTGHHFRAGRSNSTISHSRTGSGLASLHGDYHYHHHNGSSEPQQQVIRYPRERQRDMVGYSGFSPLNQTRERHHSAMTTQVQPHAGTSAIVQPWVESSHRPRPLHHVTTNTTPMPRISTQAQYNPLQAQQQQHGQNTHPHTERFMPYPCHRMDRHSSSSTFSPGSWSHDNHVITPAGGTSGRHIAPQGRSYASSSPYDLHQHPPLSGGRNGYTPNNYDYSRNNYSTTQGHPSSTQGVGHPSWMPYFTPPSQQNCSRNSSMMSHDSQATPPYPIQPHPHGSGSSSGTAPAVWRPYSERTRSSGFCLADILSLPSETEATPLSLDVTPPTGHHSFLVNRLLDDI